MAEDKQKIEQPQAIENFEESLDQLEDIVRKMEQGDLSLEQSLTCFEQGVNLTRKCQSALSQAELKIKQLTIEDEQQFSESEFSNDQQ